MMTKLIVLFLIFNLLISTTITMAGGRGIPTDHVKHPDMFFSNDRGFVIPGFGRGIKPKSKNGFNPFTYNPITGTNNGVPGFTDVPTFGGGSGYQPGSDDVVAPNPGFEAPVPNPGFEAPVPNPGGSGGFPGSAHP